jgi:hypothetical protein
MNAEDKMDIQITSITDSTLPITPAGPARLSGTAQAASSPTDTSQAEPILVTDSVDVSDAGRSLSLAALGQKALLAMQGAASPPSPASDQVTAALIDTPVDIYAPPQRAPDGTSVAVAPAAETNTTGQAILADMALGELIADMSEQELAEAQARTQASLQASLQAEIEADTQAEQQVRTQAQTLGRTQADLLAAGNRAQMEAEVQARTQADIQARAQTEVQANRMTEASARDATLQASRTEVRLLDDELAEEQRLRNRTTQAVTSLQVQETRSAAGKDVSSQAILADAALGELIADMAAEEQAALRADNLTQSRTQVQAEVEARDAAAARLLNNPAQTAGQSAISMALPTGEPETLAAQAAATLQAARDANAANAALAAQTLAADSQRRLQETVRTREQIRQDAVLQNTAGLRGDLLTGSTLAEQARLMSQNPALAAVIASYRVKEKPFDQGRDAGQDPPPAIENLPPVEPLTVVTPVRKIDRSDR